MANPQEITPRVNLGGCLVTRRVDELQPHPSYLRHHLTVPVSKLSALAERGDEAFQEPLAITRDRIILDGYARWELARHQGRVTLPCFEYELSQGEALQWILRTHQRSSGLNAFNRITLALDLESLIQEKARANQRVGGQQKGSSNLTEADKLDVRTEIAAVAGVSVGNVSKVKQLIAAADPEIQEALRGEQISIHRAWTWSKFPAEEQREALWHYREERGIKKFIRTRISRHRLNMVSAVEDLDTLVKRFSACDPGKLSKVSVKVIKAHGKTVFVTEKLLQALESQQRDLCAINGR